MKVRPLHWTTLLLAAVGIFIGIGLGAGIIGGVAGAIGGGLLGLLVAVVAWFGDLFGSK